MMAGAAALWLSYHRKAVYHGKARARGMSLQELFRYAVKASARVPAAWDAKNYGKGILNLERLLQTDLSAAVPAAVPWGSGDADVDLDAAMLLDPDDPVNGKRLLGEMFWLRSDQVDAMLEVFGHELANVLLDDPALLEGAREAARSEHRAGALQTVGRAVLGKASATFGRAVRRATG